MITIAQTETSTNLGAILGYHARKVVELRFAPESGEYFMLSCTSTTMHSVDLGADRETAIREYLAEVARIL